MRYLRPHFTFRVHWEDILILPETLSLVQLKGAISISEGTRLSLLASLVTPEMGVIVEIGSFMGKSTSFLAAGSKYGHNVPVFAIDTWDLRLPYKEEFKKCVYTVYSFKQVEQSFYSQIQPYRDIIQPIKGYSTEVAKTWKEEIGFLFIDGDHNTDAVLADYQAWSKFIPVGGFIAFHDWTIPSVRRALEQIDKSGNWGRWLQINSLVSARRRR